MYVLYNKEWAIVKKEDNGYYLYGRSTAGKIDDYTLLAINEENAINLFADDKIVLDTYDFYGIFDEDYSSKKITVEEYYNLSFKDGKDNIIEDDFCINISNMSSVNYYGNGLEIKDGAIHVIAKSNKP